MPRSRRKTTQEGVQVKGFFRLRIVEDDPLTGKQKIVGKTGWRRNTVVNLGFDQFLCQTLAGMGGSKTVSHAALGTGTAPGAADTTLNGELTDAAGMRCAVTPTTIASKTVQFAFTLASGVITANRTIQNVGLFNTSTTNVGTIFAGNTYATSQLQTNQAVNGSYQIRFS
jgi:hypothetical protein